MSKKIWIPVILIIIIVLGVYLFKNKKEEQASSNPKNATYVINGQSVTLVNGRAEVEAAPGSASKVITTTFGAPVNGDLNRDGKTDSVVMLTQETGGSGAFYYVAAVISKEAGAEGTNAILLGDRIAPQGIEIKDGQIIANYAIRKEGESMTSAPSVGVSKYIVYDGSVLKEVSK